jgi:hypothetical protein
MSEKEREGLTPEELEEQTAEVIPEREAMTVIQPDRSDRRRVHSTRRAA